jgi:hypothetical protein
MPSRPPERVEQLGPNGLAMHFVLLESVFPYFQHECDSLHWQTSVRTQVIGRHAGSFRESPAKARKKRDCKWRYTGCGLGTPTEVDSAIRGPDREDEV